MVRKRIELAQNFLKSGSLVEELVSKSSIDKSDVVYEIGPGNGIITSALIKKAAKVVIIELDENLVSKLVDTFGKVDNVEIYHGDFLDYQIKAPRYKVFSNIPFNITANIVRKLLYSSTPPEDAYLILQQEAAMKFSGEPVETEFSILVKPWFYFETLWKFQRTDFVPIPAVDVVLLHIHRREKPLVSRENIALFRKFVTFGFRAWKKDLKTAYEDVFTYEQWKRLSKDNGFPLKAIPTQLKFQQWVGLFEYFLRGVPANKKIIVTAMKKL